VQRSADHPAHLGALAGHVEARDGRRLARGRQQRREHEHRRGLARAVGAEEAVDLARGDVEVDPLNGLDAALELALEAADRDAVALAHDAAS